MVERVPDKNEVEGSIPSTPTKQFFWKLSETRIHKNEVEGSIPSTPTI